MAKELSRNQVERKKDQAAEFMDRIGESDRSEKFREMSIDDYAAGKGFRITNPTRRTTMAATKADLQDQTDNAIDLLDGAYAPEATREEMAEAIGQALSVLRGEGDDPADVDIEEDEDEEDDDLD